MVYNNYKMGSYNLHTIKTNRFKNIRMEINFRNNINKDTIIRRVLLFEYLLEVSNNYKTKRDLILKCEELYNANLYTESYKVGNEVISTIVYEILDSKYTKDITLEESLSLPFDIIFNPLIIDNEFDSKTIDTIKVRSISDAKSLREEPLKYSQLEALKAMDKNSVSSISLLGSEELINEVNKTNLYDEYKNILEHDYIDIYIIGNINEDEVLDIVNKYQHFNTIKNHELSLFVNNKTRNKPNVVIDKDNFTQAHIIYILNTCNLTKFESSYVAHIYNHILGGASLDTRLYQKLRGDNSLCYSIRSIYNKYDSLIMISTSVDFNNIKEARKLIESVIKSMLSGIKEDELLRAKQAITTSIYTSLDSPRQLIANYLFHDIAELDLIDDRINNYNKVTVKDVELLASKVKLNTIYIMESDKDE